MTPQLRRGFIAAYLCAGVSTLGAGLCTLRALDESYAVTARCDAYVAGAVLTAFAILFAAAGFALVVATVTRGR